MLPLGNYTRLTFGICSSLTLRLTIISRPHPAGLYRVNKDNGLALVVQIQSGP
jgi:hypothetical protein